ERLDDGATTRTPMRLPLPADASLRQAHALYTSGRVVAGARLAESRRRTVKLSREDERLARMLVASALLTSGDANAARVIFPDVPAASPCVPLSAARAAEERILDEMRPPVRCEVAALGHVAVASLVPGLGQAAIGSRTGAIFVATAFTVAAGVGFAFNANA